jgi:hypothetical protein
MHLKAGTAGFAMLCLLALPAGAHDSWLSRSRMAAEPGRLALELSTGTRYPVQQFGQGAASVAQSRCIDDAGRLLALKPVREQPLWLDLSAEAIGADAAALSCWVELHPVDIELQPPVVDIYFAEIRASAAVREAWAALRARGLPWRESYRKFARIELTPAAPAEVAPIMQAARRPAGLDLEIVVVGDRPIQAGQPFTVQVLRDGHPLAGLPLELVSARSPLGIWGVSDDNGTLRHTLPFGGRWLLRGTELRLSQVRPDTWESRFVTLGLEAR